jgi:outer membrane protein TolC
MVNFRDSTPLMQRLIFLLIMVVWAVPAPAQRSTVLTLEECIRLAEENSYQLQSDDYDISVAENAASVAKSRALPRISGELAVDNRFLQPYYFNQMWASVHADWFPGEMIRKTGRSSLQDLETRKLEKEQHRLSVIGRSAFLYMSILQVSKQIELLGVKVIFLSHHYQVSRGMWAAGLRSELDMMQTDIEVARLKEDSARLAIVRNDLSIELVHLLGGDGADGLHLASLQLDSLTAGPVPDISLQNLADNPVLSAFDSRLKAEQFRMDEIAAEQIPHVTMGSGFVKDDDPTGDGNYMQISAGVNIPIYSGKAYTYQKQGTRAMIESLDAQRSEAERELLIHLLKTRDKLVNTRSLMELQQNRLGIADRAVDYAEVNYKAGITSNIEYISSQQQQTNTEMEIEETRLEYVMNLIEFYITNNQVDRIVSMGYHQVVK